MKNVLVSGGAGFIGSGLVRYLLLAEPAAHIYNLDALTYAGSLENLRDLPDDGRHTFVRGDIADRDLVEDLLRRRAIDTIIHLAAETHVDRSIHGPAAFIQTNIVGTFALLEAARAVWIGNRALPDGGLRFHHVSTDEVYGSLEPEEPAFHEERAYQPNSPYAASKAASDHLVRAYAHTYGLPVSLSNCSNNYGPRQYPEKLIPLMILNAMAGEPLPLYGDGRQVRDWLFVDDHCRAVHALLVGGRLGETYNIGGGSQLTNLELVDQLCRILDELLPDSPHRPHAQLVRFVPDRPGHDRRYAMDIRKIQRELDWSPKESLASGLRKTVEWYLANGDWVEAIRSEPAYRTWMERNYASRGAKP